MRLITICFLIFSFTSLFGQKDYSSSFDWIQENFNSETDSSLVLANQIRQEAITNQDQNAQAMASYQMARCYLIKGDIQKAMEMVNESLNLFDADKNPKNTADAYNIKSIILSRLDEHDESAAFLYKAANIYQSLDDHEGLNKVYTNLAGRYIEINNIDSSLKYLNASLLSANLMKDPTMVFFAQFSFLAFHAQNNQLEKAIALKDSLIDFALQHKRHDNLATLYTIYGEIYSKNDDAENAIKYFTLADEICKAHGLAAEQLELYQSQKNHYAGKDPIKCLFYSEAYYSLKDSIYELEKIKQINQLEKELELNKHREAIATRDLKIKEQESELYKNRTFFAIAGAISFSLLLLTIFIYKQFRTKKENNILIASKNEELALKNKEITDSIHYAEKIQKALMHSKSQLSKLFKNSFLLYRPKDIVSGDFFYASEFDTSKYLILADCTGHGVPGGFMSFLGMTYLNDIFTHSDELGPLKILNQMQFRITKDLQSKDGKVHDGMDAGVIQINDKKEVTFAGAMLSLIHVKTKEQTIEIHKGARNSIGKQFSAIPFHQESFQAEAGDLLIIHSDGIVDQFGGPKEKKFKQKQLNQVIQTNFETLGSAIESALDQWMGDIPQVDDISLIILEV